jgi:DNA polymerase-3 subunit beta
MITVPTKHLKAALLAAGKQDVRFYLNGVRVEASAAETRCVGLNGILGAVLRHATVNDTIADFTAPREVIEAAIKAKRDTTEFDQLDDGHWLMNGTHRFKPVDGTFPNYRRVMPTAATGDPGRGLNPELFALFGKMAAALGRKTDDVTTHLNGENAAAITIEGYPDFAGVLSPLGFKGETAPYGLGVQGWAAQ